MIIDMHVHIGDFRLDADDPHEPLTWENLIARLDDEGIDKAVFLPVYNASPEGAPGGVCLLDDRMSVRDQVIDAGRYPERIIPFGNMDPRWLRNSPQSDFRPLFDWLIAHGCKGIGEVTANIPFDDPRTINLFQQAGEKGMLVTMESAGFLPGCYGLQDDPGAPRLEHLLQAAPETVIIGHGPGFWAEISAGVRPQDKNRYPDGPVTRGGAVPRLLRCYDNVYADLSARSAFNAITRDPAFGVEFLDEFQDKLFFATDTCFADLAGRMPQLGHLKTLKAEGKLSDKAYHKITAANAQRVLGLM
jgi:predicted TIM-barrel fold metal-dependent hydrolase